MRLKEKAQARLRLEKIMLVPSLVPINSSVQSGHVSMNLFSFLSRQKLEMVSILVSAK